MLQVCDSRGESDSDKMARKRRKPQLEGIRKEAAAERTAECEVGCRKLAASGADRRQKGKKKRTQGRGEGRRDADAARTVGWKEGRKEPLSRGGVLPITGKVQMFQKGKYVFISSSESLDVVHRSQHSPASACVVVVMLGDCVRRCERAPSVHVHSLVPAYRRRRRLSKSLGKKRSGHQICDAKQKDSASPTVDHQREV